MTTADTGAKRNDSPTHLAGGGRARLARVGGRRPGRGSRGRRDRGRLGLPGRCRRLATAGRVGHRRTPAGGRGRRVWRVAAGARSDPRGVELRDLAARPDDAGRAVPSVGPGPRGPPGPGHAAAVSEVRVRGRQGAGGPRPGLDRPVRRLQHGHVAAAGGRVQGPRRRRHLLDGPGEGHVRALRDRRPSRRGSAGADSAPDRLRPVPPRPASGAAREGPRRAPAAVPDGGRVRVASPGQRDHAQADVGGGPGSGGPLRPRRPTEVRPRRRPQRRRATLAAGRRQRHAYARHGVPPDRRDAVPRRRPGVGPGLLRVRDVGPRPHRRHGPRRGAPTLRPGHRVRLVLPGLGRGGPSDDPRHARPPRRGDVRGRRHRPGVVATLVSPEPSVGRRVRPGRGGPGGLRRDGRGRPVGRPGPGEVSPDHRRPRPRRRQPRGRRLLAVRRRVPPEVHAPRARPARRRPARPSVVAEHGRLRPVPDSAPRGVDAAELHRRPGRLPTRELVRAGLPAPPACGRVPGPLRPVARPTGERGRHCRLGRPVAEPRLVRSGS